MTERTLLEAVRTQASGARALESVRALSRFHRVQASPGYDEAATWLAGELAAIGLVPEIESVPGDGHTRYFGQLMPEGWECTLAEADLIAGNQRRRLSDYSVCELSLVLRSDPARGRFRLIAVGDGTEPEDYQGLDVRNAVVLARGAVHRVHELAVLERGAAGLLTDGRRLFPPVRGPDTDPDQVAYTSFWWSEDQPRGWGFVVSPREGAALRTRLAGGEALELDVRIDSRRFPTRIPLVSATIPGSGTGEVLVTAHLCHPRPSANDNASGVAAALETARVLHALRTSGAWSPVRTVRFLWMPEFTGTYAWLACDPERARRTAAALNLDMVGQDQDQCGSALLIESPPAFAASFAEALLDQVRHSADTPVGSYSGPGRYGLTRMARVPYAGGSDHAVWSDPGFGVPCPMLIQWPDRYYHSSHDTPDRTDPESLALAVRCAATWAGTLAAAGPGEIESLATITARHARLHALAALSREPDAFELERAALAGRAAIRSLARLGRATPAIERDLASFIAFLERETPWRAFEPPPPSGRVPHRAFAAPLHYHRHLIAGHAALPAETRERLRRLDRDTPDAHVVFELAWFLCDGRRDFAELAAAVRLETGREVAGPITEFFEVLERLGALSWQPVTEARWNPNPRATATR